MVYILILLVVALTVLEPNQPSVQCDPPACYYVVDLRPTRLAS